MFADDIKLCQEMAEKYGPLLKPMVDVGGLEDPTIAEYQITIDAMAELAKHEHVDEYRSAEIRAAQMARYQNIHRPLESTFPGYIIENPATGGLDIANLSSKYDHTIGTAILLSVLEHVEEPWNVPGQLEDAMQPGGLVVISVPWIFPWHGSPADHFRYSPTGLRSIFNVEGWSVLEAEWRLAIGADQGVLNIQNGKPQEIVSCYLVARWSG